MLTLLLDLNKDNSRGRHVEMNTVPMGSVKVFFKDNEKSKILEIKQGVNFHIDESVWEQVKTDSYIEDLKDDAALLVISEKEQNDELNILSMFNTRQSQQIINHEVSIETLELWKKGVKIKALIDAIESRINFLKGGYNRAI